MVLLTSSTVSALVSSGVIFIFTFALFISGYVLQQQTVRSLQAAMKPLIPTALPTQAAPSKVFGTDMTYEEIMAQGEQQTIAGNDEKHAGMGTYIEGVGWTWEDTKEEQGEVDILIEIERLGKVADEEMQPKDNESTTDEPVFYAWKQDMASKDFVDDMEQKLSKGSMLDLDD